MNNWADRLKLLLTAKIEEAVDEIALEGEPDGVFFPWIGDDCYRIMADAAIAVLRGMEDAQKYLKENDLLRD